METLKPFVVRDRIWLSIIVRQPKIWQLKLWQWKNLWLPKNVAIEKVVSENYGDQNCGDEKIIGTKKGGD
jgi:hypothetical protein